VSHISKISIANKNIFLTIFHAFDLNVIDRTPHMLEKLDKSAYTHEEAEKEESAEEDSGDEAEEE